MRWIWLIAAIGCGGSPAAVVAADTIAGIGKPCTSDADCVALLSCVPIDGGLVNGSYLCALRANPCPPGTTVWNTGDPSGDPICTATCSPAGPNCNYSRPCITGATPDAGLVIGACH